MMLIEKTTIMDSVEINQVLNRLAAEIVEQSQQDLLLVGIHRRGVPLARRLLQKINNLQMTNAQLATIDISFYQEDLTPLANEPIFKGFECPNNITNKDIILIDDVIYSGRTILTAINEIIKKDSANTIRLAVLIDRGHRCFPIRADYTGKHVPTRKSEHIKVMLEEIDGEDKILIMEVENKSDS